jgi:hypothetical protein
MFVSLFFFTAVTAVFVTEMQRPERSPYLAWGLVGYLEKYVYDSRVSVFTYRLNRLAMYLYPSIIFYMCLKKIYRHCFKPAENHHISR